MLTMAQPSFRFAVPGRGVLMVALVCAGLSACDRPKHSTSPIGPEVEAPDVNGEQENLQPSSQAVEPPPEPAEHEPAMAGSTKDEPAKAEPEPATTTVDPKTLLDREGEYSYGKDALGELKTGLADKDVIAKLGAPKHKDGREEEGATGEIVDLWDYPEQGIGLMMNSRTMTSAQWISGISIEAPCTFKTKLGVGVGSTRDEVLAAYGAFEDPDYPSDPDEFIAGSIYGGTFFRFRDGQVVSIYMGVGGE